MSSERDKARRGGWVFLALMLLSLGVTAVADPAKGRQALESFAALLWRVGPVLPLVVVLMFLVERFLTARRIRTWLGQGSGLRGWLLAVVAGIVSTGPAYAWYGLLAGLHAKGMRPALVAVVLYARAIKLPLLPLLAHYFGLRYTLILSLFIALFATINGWLMERLAILPKKG